MSRRWPMLTLALLLLLALGMRLYRLADLPPGLFHDEAYNTLDAQALAEGLPHPRFYDSWEIYARTIHTTWPPATTRFPVFLEGNYGREALFHYLGAVAVTLVGPRIWALRLVTALMGTLAVLTAFWVTRELFTDQPERATRLALLAAAVATGIYSLLAFSRIALRIIMLVTLEGLTVALWLLVSLPALRAGPLKRESGSSGWHASRDGRLRWWALAGLMLGLTQYTYIPARLLPLIVVFPTLVWMMRWPQWQSIPGQASHLPKEEIEQRTRLARGTLLALLIALAVAAPLIAFFVRYPAYLTLRAESIAADTPEHGLALIVANVGRVLWGLVWGGDPDPILNLPGRPLLDVVQAVFFIIGVIVCLRQARRLAYLFLLIWAAMMHTPSLVSGIAPTFGRSIGGVLPVAIIVAVGMETTWATVNARWPRWRGLATLAILGALVFSIGLAARDYFTGWARRPDLPHHFHEQMATFGRYIGKLPLETVVYITPSQKYYATFLLAMQSPELAAGQSPELAAGQNPELAAGQSPELATGQSPELAAGQSPELAAGQSPELAAGEKRDRPRDFYGPAGLLPAGDPERPAVYLILEGDETSADLLEATFPTGRWDTSASGFSAYHVPPAADRARPTYVVHADFDLIRLIGFDLASTEAHPGDVLSVRLTWQALAGMDRHYTVFVHLLGPPNPASGSFLWAQDDHEPGHATYTTDRWFPGEVIIDTFHLQIPTDAPAGEYTLSTGFYDRETLQRLPRSDTTGDTATITSIALVEGAP